MGACLFNFAAYNSNLFEFSLTCACILIGLKISECFIPVTDPRFVMEAEMSSVHVDLIQKT